MGTAQAHCCHLKPGRAKPIIGNRKSLMFMAQHLRCRNPALIEFKNTVVVTPVRHAVITRTHIESFGSLVDQKGTNQLPRSSTGALFSRCCKQNNEIGDISMADKMFSASDDIVTPFPVCSTGH